MLKRLSSLGKPFLEPSKWAERHPRHNYIGWSGLTIGLLALGLALLPRWVAPMYDPPSKPIQQKAADWFGELKDKAVAAIRMEPVAPALPEFNNPWRDRRIALSSLILGFTALALGILAFVRHEDQRLVACAVALSAGAIATAYVFTAAMILAFAMMVAMFLARSG
jgi:hypothetical protein